MILKALEKKGVYDDDLAIIITADHGEDLGELGVYAEHGVADEPVCRIPMIIRWPGMRKGAVAEGFHDNVDLLPTVQELLQTSNVSKRYHYDGVSFAETLRNGKDCSKPCVVLTQCAHVCQRSVRFGDYIYIRTVHGDIISFRRKCSSRSRRILMNSIIWRRKGRICVRRARK